MIGALPKSLNVGGRDCLIRSDFRVALTIFQAYNDPGLSRTEKAMTCLRCLYKEPPHNIADALEQAQWFLDGGNKVKLRQLPVKVIDWEQDEGLLFPEVNKSAGAEIRLLPYLHWWTFLGYFNTMSEGLYAHILNIRQKRARGKPLEKWERDFFNTHRELILLQEKRSAEEQAALDEEQAFIDSIC